MGSLFLTLKYFWSVKKMFWHKEVCGLCLKECLVILRGVLSEKIQFSWSCISGNGCLKYFLMLRVDISKTPFQKPTRNRLVSVNAKINSNQWIRIQTSFCKEIRYWMGNTRREEVFINTFSLTKMIFVKSIYVVHHFWQVQVVTRSLQR